MKIIKKLYHYTNEQLTDAYNRVAVEVYMLSQKNGYKSFAVCGSERQIGTTSVAINLAIAMSMAGWRTLLIDADMYKKNKRLSDKCESGLAQYLEGSKGYTDVICETEYSSLDYLPGGNQPTNPIGLLCSNKLHELLANVNEQYDYVIWDLPAVLEEADTKVVCAKTDATILVSAQHASMTLLKEAKESIENAGGNVVGIIGNKIEQSEYKHYRKKFRKKKINLQRLKKEEK